jgi:hypothetical protein
MLRSNATLIALFTVIAATTAAHGVVSNRWNGGEALPVLPEIPLQLGQWVGEEMKSTVDEPAIAHVGRRYRHSVSGRTFVISLSLGHPGLTAVHTPEYCYAGSGYEMAAPVSHYSAEKLPAEFWTTVFQKPDSPDQLRIFWAWSADGQWRSPSYPRLTFLGRPALCKLYVVASGPTPASSGQDPLLDDFFTELLSCLNRVLFSQSAAVAR